MTPTPTLHIVHCSEDRTKQCKGVSSVLQVTRMLHEYNDMQSILNNSGIDTATSLI